MQASQEKYRDRQGSAGRPRDPELEERVCDAAIALYAREGWRGFTFEAVARASGVGKGALHRRWQGRADLLRATLEARWKAAEHIDTGTLRGDLLALTGHLLGLLLDTHAGASINLQIDARQFDEVRAVAMPFRDRLVERFRLIVERAMARRELRQGTSTRLLLDVLVGSVTNHVVATPAALRDAMAAQSHVFANALVDLILTGILVAPA